MDNPSALSCNTKTTCSTDYFYYNLRAILLVLTPNPIGKFTGSILQLPDLGNQEWCISSVLKVYGPKPTAGYYTLSVPATYWIVVSL